MTSFPDPVPMPESTVAIIGGGPAGLACARYLAKHGFNPVVFEAAADIGGQWNPSSPSSAIWPGLRTNTSRVMTAFSDLDQPATSNVFLTQAEMAAYLERYVGLAGLDRSAIRLSTPVEALEQRPAGGWVVRFRTGAAASAELFRRVVVATGRCTAPARPVIEGLASFDGAGGVIHSAAYRGPDAYRGCSVLVLGGSVSALEIAGDLAAAGVDVTVSMRRQRYVLQKLLAGVPADHRAFTRFAARAAATQPREAVAAAVKRMVLASSGSPDQFGAPGPDDDIAVAGLTLSQSYLALVAEGRIRPRPWTEGFDGPRARFADGSSDAFDAVILGTGYEASLPFLPRAVAEALEPDGRGIDLYDHTLHPDFDGIAFVGLYPLIGPNLPVLELQARWVAYLWAGLRPTPSRDAMEAGVRLARERRRRPPGIPMHELAILFAGHAGVEPRPEDWPGLERALWFGPLSPASFRLTGPDADASAPARTVEAARAFGAIPDDSFTREESARLDALGLGGGLGGGA